MATHAVIYYTHFVSETVSSQLEKLRRELKPEFALFAMGCCPDRSTLNPLATADIEVRSYDREDLRALPYTRQLENVDWTTLRKSPDLAIMRFFRGNPQFDYYWVIEYDVRYTGDWGSLFDELAKSSAALLCSHLTTQKQNPDWIHWKSFSCADGSVEGHDLVRAFLPFVRLSKGLMRAIDERCRLGWAGHPEVLWPTIAQEVGLPIEEIGGSGSAVPPERRGKYYHSAMAPSGLFLSTFTAWPYFSEKSNFEQAPLPTNTLWHPVKE
jgi:hypothetical protein